MATDGRLARRPARAALLLLALAGAAACRRADGDLDLLRARNAVAQSRHDWARIYYQRDLQTHPERLESLRGLGISWLAGYQRSLTNGIAAYRRYLEARPDDLEIRQRLVAALLLAGDWEAARAEAARLDDSSTSQRLRARAWLDTDPAVARRSIEAALQAEAGDGQGIAETHAVAAQVLERLGERPAASAQALQALRLDPLDYETWYLSARLRTALDDREGAERDLARYRLASQVRHDGTMAPLAPQRELEVLAELAPQGADESVPFRHERASALFRSGRRDAALSDLQWLRTRPGVGTADLLELARWADGAGFLSVAADLLRQASALAPEDPGVLSSLAILDLRAGRLEPARERLSRCLEVDPAQARCLLLRGRLEIAEGAETRSLDTFERALALAPWEAAWRVEWAEALLAAGRRDEVRRIIEEAPEESPELETFLQRHPFLLDG